MIFDNMITRTVTDEDRMRNRHAHRWYFIIYCVLATATGGLSLHDYSDHKLTSWLVVQVIFMIVLTVTSYFQWRNSKR